MNANKLKNLITIFDKVESTNLIAKKQALHSAHGTTIIAMEQTGGYGRYGRSFYSPKGGLYQSIILEPSLLNITTYTAIVALAAIVVCKAIQKLSPLQTPKIKWVNDIYIDNLKVCGISAETVSDPAVYKNNRIVLGIGINFDTVTFPAELKTIAGAVNGTPMLYAQEILESILSCNLSEEDIFSEYKKRMLFLGKEVTVQAGEKSYPALILGLGASGELLIQKPCGEKHTLTAGEIRIKPPCI